jgi:rhodanese-related sulfurtransferase
MAKHAITVGDLLRRLGTPAMPVLFDVRRRAVYDEAKDIIPTAIWRDHGAAAAWVKEIPADAEPVVYCVHGHQVGQSAVAALRAAGIQARYLEGGIEALAKRRSTPTARTAPVIGSRANRPGSIA